ncbi:hypothetical protein L7F22_000691, partial [Adiantum nelumboides]|nr:hypothetical protein [Adiantum nelumboides]
MARTKQTARIEYQMGLDGQRINAPRSEPETSQAEGEDHQEEAGVSGQLGQPSTATKEKRKHRLVLYSNSDDFDAKLAIESDQGDETSTQKQPSEGSEETQTDEEPPWVGVHIHTYEAHISTGVNNLLMTEDLMLTSTQRLPSSVAPMHLEGGEGVPVMHGPMQANVVPHPLQGPLQTDGAKKKQYHGQERHVGKIREEGDFHDDDDEPPSRSRHKKRTNERRTKRSRRNSSGGSSSSSQSGRSSHGRFPKK